MDLRAVEFSCVFFFFAARSRTRTRTSLAAHCEHGEAQVRWCLSGDSSVGGHQGFKSDAAATESKWRPKTVVCPFCLIGSKWWSVVDHLDSEKRWSC